ncbi:NUMOD4 motif-containing HNH endonuclease [Gardnerella vaginalis]|uniref:NUMOD4 motif-containing HNH endonuclease n=1 Tax=Gardnerella vaginalis TaxID=2702 RepID=UPI000C7C54BB|nr:NUMOD4 motif-containing HNH endonuclease [Gardnerella vaginalis]PKZ45231.1 HNH endonuclease [Gardnerella vaginalis]
MKNRCEIWKDIPGYEGKYQASTEGRIRSLSRYVRGRCHFTGHYFKRKIKGRILRSGKFCKTGHLSVVLGHGENGRPVHQLVLLTFKGKPDKDQEVLHINGDPADNRLCNLRYGTRTENILDVYKQGGKWRKLSIEDVYMIRFYLLCGFTGSSIAKKFNVSPFTISCIKLRRTYGWLK